MQPPQLHDRTAQSAWRACAGEHVGDRLLDPGLADVQPATGVTRQGQIIIGDGRATAGTLGDDRPDAVVVRSGADRFFATHRQPQNRDTVGFDVRTLRQIGDGGGCVEVAVPAPVHRDALAFAVAARIGRQHPVAGPGEDDRLVEGAGARGGRAVAQDDRRAVA